MKGVEIVARLNQLLEDRSADEKNIEIELESSGIDVGLNIKTRLNYLITLGILRHPEPKYFGKGRGGTRLFQRDVMDVLGFVDEHKGSFTFNEIAGTVKERREDLTRQFCKDYDVEKHSQDPSIAVQTCITFAHHKCLFKKDLLCANVLGTTISEINNHLTELKAEIAAFDSFRDDMGKAFCKDDQKILSNYIRRKKNRQKGLNKSLDGFISEAKDLVEKILIDEY